MYVPPSKSTPAALRKARWEAEQARKKAVAEVAVARIAAAK